MKKKIALSALLSLSCLSPISHAGEFFIGLNAGTATFDALNDACDDLIADNVQIGGLPLTCNVNDDSDTALSINAGYNFNRYLGLEIGYVDMGEYSASVTASRITLNATAEVDYTYGALVLSAPLTDKFSLSARLGGASANANVGSQIGISGEIEDETVGFVGASADYRLNDRFSFQVRYDTFSDADITTAGIRVHF